MFNVPILCDRRIYDKKGKWKSPNNDIEENLFYFIKEPLTISSEWVNGKEQIVETTTITIFGGKPIVKGDLIVLEDGTIFRVDSITINYIENNILLKDLLKPQIESMDLVLR